jgi:excisionase family DNA binding protein
MDNPSSGLTKIKYDRTINKYTSNEQKYIIVEHGGLWRAAMDDRWLSTKEASIRYGLAVSWFYSRAEAGILPCYKVGKYLKFRQSELDAWLEAQRLTPPKS